MKKALLTIAVLSAFAAEASAQSNITMYGVADLGVVVENGGAAGNVVKLTSGIMNGSRLGFKGVEDLGGGLSAHFVLESGFQMDAGTLGQGGLLFGRQGFVGITGGFGSVDLGRQYTPEYLTVAASDPFGNGLAGTSSIVIPYSAGNPRASNTIKYTSPKMSGFTTEIIYVFGETAGGVSRNSAYGGALSYATGAAQIRFGYHNKNAFSLGTATAPETNSSAKNTFLAATYNFGAAKAFFGYGVNKGPGSSPFLNANPYGAAVAPAGSTDSSNATVGVLVPVGQHTFIASYIRKDDKNLANRDADQGGIGYTYDLSKRTAFYASYAKVNNKNGAAYTVGSAIEVGSGDSAFNFGVRHSF